MSTSMSHAMLDKWMGSIVGLAVGDQLGCLVEGKSPGTFDRVKDIPEGSFWTDDTSQALCLADSLISVRTFDINDQLQRYSNWLFNGYLSCKEWAYGCGPTARLAITGFKESGCPTPVTSQKTNGALMRLAPVPLFYSKDLAIAAQKSGESARSTHDNSVCIDACRLYGSMIAKAVTGHDKPTILKYQPDFWAIDPLESSIDQIARGSYKDKEPPMIKGTLDITESIEAALWAYDRTSSFAEGALRAVNLGDDADTTGAIFGQLGGAYYGHKGIPESWKSKLVDRALIEYVAQKLYEVHIDSG